MNTLSRTRSISWMVLGLVCSVVQLQTTASARSRRPSPSGLATLFSILIVPVSAQAQASEQAPSAPDSLPLPEGKGREVTKAACSKCHGTNVFAAQRHTPEQWSAIIDQMVSKGLEATDDQLDQITEYLSIAFPAPAKKDAPEAAPPVPAPH